MVNDISGDRGDRMTIDLSEKYVKFGSSLDNLYWSTLDRIPSSSLRISTSVSRNEM